MNKLAFGSALAALSLVMPGAALAQRNNAAQSILVVDTERVVTECTACRAASAQVQQQIQQAQQLAQQLSTPLQSEGQQIETAVRGLNGRQPDAALQTRITNFQNRQNQANQQLGQREQAIRSTQAHVNQQIGERLVAVAEQVRAARNATAVMAKNSLLANSNNIDVTAEVLAQLNTQLPSVSVTPLPQAQQPAQPQQPRPQGR